MEPALRFIGASVCHQLADRSLSAGGAALPVCARCTGIYLSIFITFTYMCMRKRLLGDKPPGPVFLALSVLGMVSLMADGLTSYIGLRESSNIIRLFTGLASGACIPVFLILPVNYRVNGTNVRVLVKGPSDILWLFLTLLSAALLVYNGLLGRLAVSVIICAGILILFFLIANLLIGVAAEKINRMARYILSGFCSVGAVTALSVLHRIISARFPYI